MLQLSHHVCITFLMNTANRSSMRCAQLVCFTAQFVCLLNRLNCLGHFTLQPVVCDDLIGQQDELYVNKIIGVLRELLM